MRTAAVILLTFVALLSPGAMGCGRVPSQVGDTSVGPPPSISPDRWMDVCSVSSRASSPGGTKGPAFTAGGRLLIRVAVDTRGGSSLGWALFPVPEKALPRGFRYTDKPYSGGTQTTDHFTSSLPHGRYRVQFYSPNPCTITVYVRK
jgi:hypothetical protein